MKHQILLPVAASMVPLLTANASLFSETFDTSESSSSFLVSQIAGSTDVITFGYDYSGKGIPEAPSTPVGAEMPVAFFFRPTNRLPAAVRTTASI